MPGSLATSVVDAVRGAPAAGMLVDLFRLPRGHGERRHLRTIETDATGTLADPLLAGDEFVPATYELLFHVGRYFKAQRVTLDDAPFVDVIPVRFTIGDTAHSYRFALLASPWHYTVFRG
jgi:5-hydroxyisourate hydrolase